VSTGDDARTPFRSWTERAEEVAAQGRFEIGIPMRGIELAADVYLPSDADDQGTPAIVQVTPCGKDSESLVSDEALLYQSNGYAFVAVDVRGRGKSEGDWIAFFNDAKDTHDVIEWVAAQPWCNGKVGTTGLSYMGNLALAALPGFAFPGDTSASARYYHQDITAPFVLSDGHLPVPDGPGIGVEPIPDVLASVITDRRWLPADSN
jgi:X-Pro dipeptidyl-peptidase (S15 family)